MRILMVNLTDWSGMSGGAQHQLGLFEAFRAQGHELRVLTVGHGECPAMPYGVREVASIVEDVSRFGLPGNLNTLAQLPALIGQIMSFRPDVIYSRANTFSLAVVAVGKMLGVRVVLEHNSWLESQRRVGGGSSWLGAAERYLQIGASRLADASRCVTQGLVDRLAQAGVAENRLHAIGNGTDCDHFFPIDRNQALQQFGLPADRTYIGFIGNIMPWHGLTTALDGFSRLAAAHPKADMLVFGDGPGLAPLVEMARRLGLTERVRIMGKVPFAAANAAINCFDLSILPLSLRQDIGFGFSAIKLRDYAAAGRIVLTGLVPGNIELSAEPWLITHAPDDAGDFASALGLWLESQQGDQGHWELAQRQARVYALQNFAWSKIAARIADFIGALDPALTEPVAARATGRLKASALSY
jgi:glycosyltransferase involved in cell wall biosynthesis